MIIPDATYRRMIDMFDHFNPRRTPERAPRPAEEPVAPPPMPEFLWDRECSAFVDACLRERGVTYEQLAEELRARGTDIAAHALQKRVSAGNLSTGLFFQIMHVLGHERVRLASVFPYDGD